MREDGAAHTTPMESPQARLDQMMRQAIAAVPRQMENFGTVVMEEFRDRFRREPGLEGFVLVVALVGDKALAVHIRILYGRIFSEVKAKEAAEASVKTVGSMARKDGTGKSKDAPIEGKPVNARSRLSYASANEVAAKTLLSIWGDVPDGAGSKSRGRLRRPR
jgi:hypothetical protein